MLIYTVINTRTPHMRCNSSFFDWILQLKFVVVDRNALSKPRLCPCYRSGARFARRGPALAMYWLTVGPSCLDLTTSYSDTIYSHAFSHPMFAYLYLYLLAQCLSVLGQGGDGEVDLSKTRKLAAYMRTESA